MSDVEGLPKVDLLTVINVEGGETIVFGNGLTLRPGPGRYWVAAFGVLLFDDGRHGMVASDETRARLHKPNLKWRMKRRSVTR